jgi:hypothetical protein
MTRNLIFCDAMSKRPFELRIFTRRLRRLSAVTLILTCLTPIRFDFDYVLGGEVMLVFWLASYEITYRREARRAFEKDYGTYVKWKFWGSLGFLLLVVLPAVFAAIVAVPPDNFFPYYCTGAIGFWLGIIAGEWHWRWKFLNRLSGEERGRYWSRYNDALFYTIPF